MRWGGETAAPENSEKIEDYFWSVPAQPTILPVKEKLKKIRVNMDCHFAILILTHTHTFTDRLFTFLNTGDELPLKILPVKVSVTVEQRR